MTEPIEAQRPRTIHLLQSGEAAKSTVIAMEIGACLSIAPLSGTSLRHLLR